LMHGYFRNVDESKSGPPRPLSFAERRAVTDWFGANAYIPHGFCMAWEPDLMAAVLLSNGLIALAYMFIAGWLVLKAIEPAPVMPAWRYWGFAAFIFCCGVSHILDDVTLWFPVYRLQALVLAITALVSLFTAMLLLPLWFAREVGRRR
jgi:two-component system, NtrC family, sensor kinase